jgi:hypothetical protein
MSNDKSVTGDTFRVLVSASTGLAIGGLLAALAMLERSTSGGIGLRFSWLAPFLFVAGFTAGWQFWRFMFRASELDPAVSRRILKRWGVLFGLIAVLCFAYPIRFAASEKKRDVVDGIVLAIAALGVAGTFTWRTIQMIERSERESLARLDAEAKERGADKG